MDARQRKGDAITRAGTQDPVRGSPTRPSAGSPAPEGSEGEEAGKVEVLRTIGGRSTERNVTLLFTLAPRMPSTTEGAGARSFRARAGWCSVGG